MSMRPWRAECRALPGHGLRDERWAAFGTYGTPERAREFIERERPYHKGWYEYRLVNRDTAEVISL